MSQLQITHKFTLLCDDVRREDNGKLIIVGLYTPNIMVSQIPIVFPTLTFLQWIETSSAGQFQFNSSLEFLETGTKIAQVIGIAEPKEPGPMFNILRFMNLKIQNSGAYTFTTLIDKHAEPIVHSFQINLRQS